MGVVEHTSGAGWSDFVRGRPAPTLRGHVRSYDGYAEFSAVPLRRREVPSTTVSLILSLGPRIEVESQGTRRSFVAGLHDEPAVTSFAGDQLGVQVKLTPLAAWRLLGGAPMDAFGLPVVELEDVLGRDAVELVERLCAAPSWEARFGVLDRVIAARLADAPEPPPEVAWAWGRLVATGGGTPIRMLGGELGWSERRLLRAFREHVGVAPKTYARMLRFRRAIERLERADGGDLGRIALDCGFYDQAHFNRDFRAFAGGPPGDYLARRMPGGLGVAA